jgi:hypothetical protein
MLKTWFNSAGWPKDVAAADHSGFAHTILRFKDAALEAMLRGGEVPLRDGECGLGCSSGVVLQAYIKMSLLLDLAARPALVLVMYSFAHRQQTGFGKSDVVLASPYVSCNGYPASHCVVLLRPPLSQFYRAWAG